MSRVSDAWVVLLVLCLAAVLFASVSGLPVGNWTQRNDNNLIALYTFEEGNGISIKDISSSPKEDLELNPNVVSWLPYSTGVSLKADGTEFSIKSNGTSQLAQTLSTKSSWAIEMWLEITSDIATQPTLFAFDECGMSAMFSPMFSNFYYSFKPSTSSCKNTIMSTSALRTPGIHHLVISAQIETIMINIDGNNVAEAPRDDGGTLQVATEILTIGRAKSPDPDLNLDGKFYLVAFYGRDVSLWQTKINFNAGLPNQPPIVYDSSVQTDEDVPIVITLNGTDPEGRSLDFVLETLPSSYYGWLYTLENQLINTTPYTLSDCSQVRFVPNPDVYTNRSGVPDLLYRPVNFTFSAEEHSLEPGASVKKSSRWNAIVAIDIIERPDPPVVFNQSGIEISDWQAITLNITGKPVDDYQTSLFAGELLTMTPPEAGILKNAAVKITSLPFNVSQSENFAFSFELIPFPLQGVPHNDVEFAVRVYDTNGPSAHVGTISIRILNSLTAQDHSVADISAGETVEFQLPFDDLDSNRVSMTVTTCFKLFNIPATGELLVGNDPVLSNKIYCDNGLNVTFVAPLLATPGVEIFSFAIVLSYNTSDADNITAESTPADVTLRYQAYVAPSSSEYVSSSVVMPSPSVTSASDLDSSMQSTDSFVSSSHSSATDSTSNTDSSTSRFDSSSTPQTSSLSAPLFSSSFSESSPNSTGSESHAASQSDSRPVIDSASGLSTFSALAVLSALVTFVLALLL